MMYNLNNKKINIPQETIEQYKKVFALDDTQAIQMYLEEEGYIESPEIEELTAKAKANKTDKIVVTDKTKPRAKSTREPKNNPLKAEIIQNIYKMLKDCGVVDIKITNSNKLIEFSIDNRDFKLDLIEKRVKKP